MADFSNLKQGDVLLRTARMFGCGGYTRERFNMIEWVEMTVEKVTPKFYFVDGRKYDKASGGKHFMNRHYLPGEDGAPLVSNTAEFEEALELHRKVRSVDPFIRSKLDKLASLTQAAYFAEKIKALDAELDLEISRSVE